MKFYEGQTFEYGGIFYRVIAGTRCNGDLILEFSCDGVFWRRPYLAHTFILTNFKFQVEENNYGPEGEVQVGRGGFYLLDKIKEACLYGWESIAKETAQQSANRNGKCNLARENNPCQNSLDFG